MGFQRCLVHNVRYEDYGECATCAHERRMEELAYEQLQAAKERVFTPEPEDDSDARLLQAKLASAARCIEAGDHSGALIALAQALQVQPDSSDVHLAYARAYLGSGETERARHHARLAWRYGKSSVTGVQYVELSEAPDAAWEEVAVAGCVPRDRSADVARILSAAGRMTAVDKLLSRVGKEEVRAQIARLVAGGANSDARERFDKRLSAIFAEEEQAAKAAEAARQATVAAAENAKLQAARARSEQAAREMQQAAEQSARDAARASEKSREELLENLGGAFAGAFWGFVLIGGAMAVHEDQFTHGGLAWPATDASFTETRCGKGCVAGSPWGIVLGATAGLVYTIYRREA